MPKPSNLSIASSLVMDKKKPIKNTGIALLIAQFLLINFNFSVVPSFIKSPTVLKLDQKPFNKLFSPML